MAVVQITQADYEKVREFYFRWKDLSNDIKAFYTRGLNIHESFTEVVCCYINGYLLSIGGGSEDAVIPNTGELVQVKATSNWDKDLTSFGPTSSFDHLHFVRLNQEDDRMHLYYIPTNDLKNVMVNSDTTFAERQAEGKRPRFSIIDKYIEPYDIQPYAVADMRTGEIFRF